jgi:hypothetical protein
VLYCAKLCYMCPCLSLCVSIPVCVYTCVCMYLCMCLSLCMRVCVRGMQGSMEGRAISVMLPGLLCASYLSRLRDCAFDPLAPDMLVPPRRVAVQLQALMLKSAWTKTI